MRSLRLLLAAVLMGALLASLLPGVPAHAGIRVEHHARATFLLPPKDGQHPAIYVDVTDMDAGGYKDFSISRGFCASKDLDSCVITRPGGLFGRLHPTDGFEIEPDLSTAQFEVTRRGTTHRISWTATSQAAPVFGAGCEPFMPWAGAQRDATATGHIFGRKLKSSAGFLEFLAFTC